MDYQKLIDKLLEGGDARSAVFRQGLTDALKRRVDNLDVAHPYREGSVEYDAYFAGCHRGNNEWRYALHISGNERSAAVAYLERLVREAA